MGCQLCKEIDYNQREIRSDQKAVLLVPGMVSNSLEVLDGGAWRVAWIRPLHVIDQPEVLTDLTLRLCNATTLAGKDVVSTASVEGATVRVVEGLNGIATLNPGAAMPHVPLHLWKDMIDRLAPDFNVVSFNYDWRRWGDVAYAELLVEQFQEKVERCVMTTEQPVTIIGHSMGAPVTIYCLSQLGHAWTSRNIDAVILLGPAMGTPTMFPSFACGPIAGMFSMIPAEVHHKIAHITSTWPCMVAEFPMRVGNTEVFDPHYPFVKTPTKRYFFKDVERFLEDTAKYGTDVDEAYTFGKKLYPGILSLHRSMLPPVVPVHLIYSAGQQCPTQWLYATENLLDAPTATDFQRGDNTVLASSVTKWSEAWTKVGCKVTLHRSPDEENHSSLIKSEFCLDLVESLLEGLDSEESSVE